MDTFCMRLPNLDRVGLVQDISSIVARQNINILSMEVEPNTVYLEVEPLRDEKKIFLSKALREIPQVIDVAEIHSMPSQQHLDQVKAILTSVGDGIIAVDEQQRITQYNPAAERIIRLPYNQVIGCLLTDIFPPDIPLMESVKSGLLYDNREIILENTKSHYLTSGRPVVDSTGCIIGAVAILKDISDVRKLVHSFAENSQSVFHDILYKSQTIQKVVNTINAIAPGDSTVLIRGETGTGKELVARSIHASSTRAHKAFVPLNCAAIPETLLESELFGYQRGAFTGAEKNGKPGLFEVADGGTLFLDEVSDLSLPLQAKLLRVLQEGKIRRLGSSAEKPVNVRILAATNQHLEELIAQGLFREDLYYRLNVIPLFVPPLRDRREDIPLLARYFFQRFSVRLHKAISNISETALSKLTQYSWPGNIRELENVIERAVNMINGAIILAEHIEFDHEYEAPAPPHGAIAAAVAKVEYDILVNTMKHCRSARGLAKALGLSHTAVLKKMQKYGLRFP